MMRFRWLPICILVLILAVSISFIPRPARASTITTVDSAGDVGYYTSIAILNGLPVISYYDNTNGDLKVVACGDETCNNGDTITTVDSGGDVGYYTSIATLNGAPVISYTDGTNGDLKVAACGNEFCTASNTI